MIHRCRIIRNCFTVCLAVFIGFILAGCGNRPAAIGVIVTGQILVSGKPLELVRPDVGLGVVQVTLIPENEKGAPVEGALADKDGKFVFRGAGNGIPPKIYKLSVRHWKEGPGTKDELDDVFTPEDTPIIGVEVPKSASGKNYDIGVFELTEYKSKKKES